MISASTVCSNCTGSIEIDESNGSGFCAQCGREVTAKEVPKGHDEDICNWTALARSAHTSRDHVSSEYYAKKILEADGNIGIAWFFKGCAAVHDPNRSNEAFDHWNRASKLMSIDEKKENYYDFLYELTSYDEERSAPTPAVSFDPRTMKEQARTTLRNYLTGFDGDTLCVMLYDGACSLKDRSEGEKSGRYDTMLEAAEIMLHNSLAYDKDIDSIIRTYSKKLEIAKRSKERTKDDFKYSMTGLRVFLLTRAIRRADDPFIEYYSKVHRMLSDISSSMTDKERADARRYWDDEKNKERAKGIFNRRIEAENEYFRVRKKRRDTVANRKAALESLESLFRETAFPLGRSASTGSASVPDAPSEG